MSYTLGVNLLAIFGGLGVPEILLVLFVMLLLFGSAKLPKLARSLGSSVTEFRKGIKGEGDEEKQKLSGGEGEGDSPDEPSDDAGSATPKKED